MELPQVPALQKGWHEPPCFLRAGPEGGRRGSHGQGDGREGVRTLGRGERPPLFFCFGGSGRKRIEAWSRTSLVRGTVPVTRLSVGVGDRVAFVTTPVRHSCTDNLFLPLTALQPQEGSPDLPDFGGSLSLPSNWGNPKGRGTSHCPAHSSPHEVGDTSCG